MAARQPHHRHSVLVRVAYHVGLGPLVIAVGAAPGAREERARPSRRPTGVGTSKAAAGACRSVPGPARLVQLP
jgi:hypothetical protein